LRDQDKRRGATQETLRAAYRIAARRTIGRSDVAWQADSGNNGLYLERNMSTYGTFATVESHGQLRIAGVPFAPGTEVEVSISPKRRPSEEFAVAWHRICAELRNLAGAQGITEEEIRGEIDRYRAGR
jgi:hypothetical protein